MTERSDRVRGLAKSMEILCEVAAVTSDSFQNVTLPTARPDILPDLSARM